MEEFSQLSNTLLANKRFCFNFQVGVIGTYTNEEKTWYVFNVGC